MWKLLVPADAVECDLDFNQHHDSEERSMCWKN